MAGIELVLLLLAVSVALRVLADRWRIPYATLLVLGGLGLSAVPRLPRITIAPDVLFLIFVPPLLYWGAAMFPLRDLRRESGPILRLAVIMVLVSTAATALVVHAIDPAFTWPAAFLLGAIVSPPDPVAVLSLMRWVRLPSDVAHLLEGEGLLNDATALVIYRICVTAALTGLLSPWRAVVAFVIAGGGGVVVGVLVGMLALWLRRLTRGINVADGAMLMLIPFAAYLAAEGVSASGVLSVVAAAMYVGRTIQSEGSPALRLQSLNVWTMVTFLLESLIFILTGLELPSILHNLDFTDIRPVIFEAGLVYLCICAVRLAWVFPSAYVGHWIGRRLRRSADPYASWQKVLFVGWAGVRGGDSVVIALALPLATAAGHAFPARSRIILITFCVVLATLVINGPTLRPLAIALGLCDDGSEEQEEAAAARLASEQAGLYALDTMTGDESPEVEIADFLRQQHGTIARRWSRKSQAEDERRATTYRRFRSGMIAAGRLAILRLRDGDKISDDVLRRVQREFDLEELLLESSDPGALATLASPPSER